MLLFHTQILKVMNAYTTLINSAPLVMVEFYATWCPHCQRMMPVIAQIRELLGSSAEIYQLDIDKDEDAAAQAEIESTPTFIIYRDGKMMWRYSGELDGNVLLQKIESYMN